MNGTFTICKSMESDLLNRASKLEAVKLRRFKQIGLTSIYIATASYPNDFIELGKIIGEIEKEHQDLEGLFEPEPKILD